MKVRVKAKEDFFDHGNYQHRKKGEEFILQEFHAKDLKGKVEILEKVKQLKEEAVPKEKRSTVKEESKAKAEAKAKKKGGNQPKAKDMTIGSSVNKAK